MHRASWRRAPPCPTGSGWVWHEARRARLAGGHLCAGGDGAAGWLQPHQPRILVLHSGTRGSGWNQRIDEGIRTALDRNRRPVTVHWYYLGLERSPSRPVGKTPPPRPGVPSSSFVRMWCWQWTTRRRPTWRATTRCGRVGTGGQADNAHRLRGDRRPAIELWLRHRGQRQRRAGAVAAGGHAGDGADAAQRPASAAGGDRPG